MLIDMLMSAFILAMLTIGYFKKRELDNVVLDDDFDDDLSC
jgi:hypothetical protein